MSLVGSLEDLGLGDILQIISLSRKSGVLLLRSDRGEGRIVFREGLVHGAGVKGGPEDLRSLVVTSGALSAAAFETAQSAARTRGVPLAEALAEQLPNDRIEELRRAATESAVLEMFQWRVGEFSFEIRDEGDSERQPGLLLTSGLSAQYLAMEGTRLRDETSLAGAGEGESDGASEDTPTPFDDAQGLVLSGEEAATPQAPDLVEVVAEAVIESADADDDVEAEVAVLAELADGEEMALAVEEGQSIDLEPASGDRTPGDESPGLTPPVIAIHPELAPLEWVKRSLQGAFPRVHIFQRTELGTQRIRQYLARGEAPVVMVSDRARPDPLSGARNVSEVVDRLKAQAPRTPVLLWVEAEDKTSLPARADGCVERPATSKLSQPRHAAQIEELAQQVQLALKAWARRAGRRREARDGGASLSADVARLKEASARLRDPRTRGDVLPLVMRFAAEHFSRVAMFMLRDDLAVGMAQIGLAHAGGPDDAGLRRVQMAASTSGWLRAVLGTRNPVRGRPGDAGDLELASRLGSCPAREAYLAPIESGEQVVAFLYGDNLPRENPIGDTSALEVILHEAGLALDRAMLERALAEAEGAQASEASAQ